MPAFLGIKNNKWIAIFFLFGVLIICLGLAQYQIMFKTIEPKKEGFKEGLISQDQINTINCAFNTYSKLVNALCLYHITGQVPSAGSENINAYLSKTGTSLQNIGLSTTDNLQAQILNVMNQIAASGTTQITPTAAMASIQKLYVKDQQKLKIMFSVMTSHNSARITLLSNFLNYLRTIIPENSSEDTHFSTLVSNGLNQPVIFSTGTNGMQDSFTELNSYFISTYSGQVNNSFTCPALTM